jgi:hypothetical protein
LEESKKKKMMRILLKSSLLGGLLVLGLTSINAQNEGQYDPDHGTTIWHLPGGDVVIYDSDGGSTVNVCRNDGQAGPCEQTDCTEDEKGCRDILEDASEGKTPPPNDDGDDSGGESTQALQNVLSEFNKFRKGKQGRVFFRSKAGKWLVIKEVRTWNQRVLKSL